MNDTTADERSMAATGDALARGLHDALMKARVLTTQILADEQVSSDATFTDVEALRMADLSRRVTRAGARNDWPAMDEADEAMRALVADIASTA